MQAPKKGQRGKKLCPDCQQLMPIHCQKCKICDHEFHMNHKPKKQKEYVPSQNLFTFDEVKQERRSVSLILSKTNFYGSLNPKHYRRERISLPEIQFKQQSHQKHPTYAFNNPFLNKGLATLKRVTSIEPETQSWQTSDIDYCLKNQSYIKRSMCGEFPSPYLEQLSA